jgi:hydroxypyruvate isomerase
VSFDLGISAPAPRFGVDSTEAGIERAAAVGVDGVEVFGVADDEIDAVVAAGERHGIDVFGTLGEGAAAEIDGPDAPCMVRPEHHDQAVADIRRGVETVEKLEGESLILTVGQRQEDLDVSTQQTAIVDVLRAAAPAAEAAGVTLLVEPLNVRVNHPGDFLRTTDRGVSIVDAVDHPNVKLLFDAYHQQITEGDICRRFYRHVEHIGHVHIADNPGRHEPGTGEIDHGFLFETIAESDYDGWVSCEFQPTGDPDEAFRHVVELANAARDR